MSNSLQSLKYLLSGPVPCPVSLDRNQLGQVGAQFKLVSTGGFFFCACVCFLCFCFSVSVAIVFGIQSHCIPPLCIPGGAV